MRQRIRKDVLPYAIEFLGKQHKTSLKSGPMYRFSQSCKLQLMVINLIGSMVPNLEFSGDDLGKSAMACSLYLDCRQPPLLQEVRTSYTRFLLSPLLGPVHMKVSQPIYGAG